MIERGLVEEVQRLTANGKQLGRTASQAVGYREVIDFLADGNHEKMLADIKTHPTVLKEARHLVPQLERVPVC